MGEIEENENIVNNIKYLLNERGIKQNEFAKKIYKAPNTVNQWLNEEERNVPPADLDNIADFFEVSVDLLKSYDLQKLNEGKDTSSNKEKEDKIKKEILGIVFPYIKDEKLLKNNSFKEAVEIHEKVIKDEINVDEKLIDKCCSLYLKVYNDDGFVEGLINIISIVAIYSYTKRKKYEKYNVFSLIYLINKKMEYKELTDYYIGILFRLNLINFSYRKSENALFGDMYLSILEHIKNEYALKFIDYGKKNGFINE